MVKDPTTWILMTVRSPSPLPKSGPQSWGGPAGPNMIGFLWTQSPSLKPEATTSAAATDRSWTMIFGCAMHFPQYLRYFLVPESEEQTTMQRQAALRKGRADPGGGVLALRAGEASVSEAASSF